MWSKEEDFEIVQRDQERTWNKLVSALGLPNKIFIPLYLESDKSFGDEIYQGKKFESLDTSHNVEPATLSLWQPQERQLTITLYQAKNFEPYRHYEFSVHPSTKAGHSEIRLVLRLSLGMLQGMFFTMLREGQNNLVQMVLEKLVSRFHYVNEDTTSSKR